MCHIFFVIYSCRIERSVNFICDGRYVFFNYSVLCVIICTLNCVVRIVQDYRLKTTTLNFPFISTNIKYQSTRIILWNNNSVGILVSKTNIRGHSLNKRYNFTKRHVLKKILGKIWARAEYERGGRRKFRKYFLV